MTIYDALVIGCGPAGAVAAAGLARAGRRVGLLAPERQGPRIGECLPPAGARLLRTVDLPGPLSNDAHRKIGGIISAWGGPPMAEDSLGSPDGPGWRLDRERFDRDLVDAAVESGAERINDTAIAVERVDWAWRVETEASGFHNAARLIDATGRKSVLARSLNLERHHHSRQTAIWAAGMPAAEGKAATTRTLIESTEEGWWYGAWLPDTTPLAAFHAGPSIAGELRADPDRFLHLLRRTALVSRHLPPEAFVEAPIRFNEAGGRWIDPVAGDGWIAVGDAAMAFEPLSSQGILNAVATGMKATEIMLSEEPEAATTEYRNKLETVRESYRRWHRSLYDRSGVTGLRRTG